MKFRKMAKQWMFNTLLENFHNVHGEGLSDRSLTPAEERKLEAAVAAEIDSMRRKLEHADVIVAGTVLPDSITRQLGD